MTRWPIVIGNASVDGSGVTRGWLLGHFMPPDDPRHADAVEVKWGVHAAGESRSTVAPGTGATTLSILVTGTFRVDFPDREVLLSIPGDYVLFGPGVPHGWTAEADAVVVTVRWPSAPGPCVEKASAEDR